MTKILAFDTAISTGCAFGVSGGKPTAWTVNLGKATWDRRFARTLLMVERYVRQFQPDLVVVEAPSQGSFGNPDLGGLATCVRAQAARMGVAVEVYYPGSIKKHFLGKGFTSKDFPHLTRPKAKAEIKRLTVARCYALGIEVQGHDEADAVALWSYAAAQHGAQTMPAWGLFG